ncbi:MAG TPA: hypothetical protein VMH35_14375 [Streptosporangiaceae bacterium]|nr:hypothetical protein [Streptosporangiaceae bacterium]
MTASETGGKTARGRLMTLLTRPSISAGVLTWIQACRAEIIDLMKRLNIATDGTMHVDAEYLVVIATKNR